MTYHGFKIKYAVQIRNFEILYYYGTLLNQAQRPGIKN